MSLMAAIEPPHGFREFHPPVSLHTVQLSGGSAKPEELLLKKWSLGCDKDFMGCQSHTNWAYFIVKCDVVIKCGMP